MKQREIPIQILQLQALYNRLANDHEKKREIADDLVRRQAGYRGEAQLDYYLQLIADKDEAAILRDLRLPYESTFFQIDTLIIFPKLIFIIEVKNISGIVQLDPVFKQMIRISNEKEESFKDPISQAELHRYQLQQWLQVRKLPLPPIEWFVVFTNPATIIKTKDDTNKIFQRVFHVEHLLLKIRELLANYDKSVLTINDVKKLRRKLIQQHEPPQYNFLSFYNIDLRELRAGVQCPQCDQLPMKRIHGKWKCRFCGAISKDAHIQALQDYFLLWKDTITNKECREFLHLESSKTANTILKSMNLVRSGEKKGRIYRVKK